MTLNYSLCCIWHLIDMYNKVSKNLLIRFYICILSFYLKDKFGCTEIFQSVSEEVSMLNNRSLLCCRINIIQLGHSNEDCYSYVTSFTKAAGGKRSLEYFHPYSILYSFPFCAHLTVSFYYLAPQNYWFILMGIILLLTSLLLPLGIWITGWSLFSLLFLNFTFTYYFYQ